MSLFWIVILSGILLAYLIGSFPTAIVIGKIKMGIDIRDYGSGNAGATNTFRVLGTRPGITVMAIDVFKGYTAATLAQYTYNFGFEMSDNNYVALQIALGMAAVIGHIFPIYARFKGGKGVASLLGIGLALNLGAALACILVFLIVFLLTKYVSLGSMISGLAFPILVSFPAFNNFEKPSEVMIGFGIVVFLLLVLTHKKNIKRLIAGEENKIDLKKKKQTD